MTTAVISRHAVERYIERVEPLTKQAAGSLQANMGRRGTQ